MKIDNLESFDISNKDLKKNIKLTVNIHLQYPKYKKWLKLSPRERVAKIDDSFISNFKLLSKSLNRKFSRIGSKKKPRGITTELYWSELVKISYLKIVDSVFITGIEGALNTQLKHEDRAKFISVKARIAIQIEGKEKGKQSYEERILIIKARSCKSAKKKLTKEFKSYERPYLNSDGRLVRWKLEKFIDCYETEVYHSGEFDYKYGNEVFSIIKERKITSKMVWDKQWLEK